MAWKLWPQKVQGALVAALFSATILSGPVAQGATDYSVYNMQTSNNLYFLNWLENTSYSLSNAGDVWLTSADAAFLTDDGRSWWFADLSSPCGTSGDWNMTWTEVYGVTLDQFNQGHFLSNPPHGPINNACIYVGPKVGCMAVFITDVAAADGQNGLYLLQDPTGNTCGAAFFRSAVEFFKQVQQEYSAVQAEIGTIGRQGGKVVSYLLRIFNILAEIL